MHSDRKIILGFWREKHVDGFLDERLVAGRRRSHLDDVKFSALGSSDSETEEGRVGRVSLHPELNEGRGVALDRLADLSLDRVELHGADDAVLLGRDADQQEPEDERIIKISTDE